MQQDKEKDSIAFLDKNYKINIIDFFIVLAKHKWLIIGSTLGAAVISAIISLIMTPVYRAETRVLPPQQELISASSQMFDQFGPPTGALRGMAGVKNITDLYIELLKSRPILDKIIDRFGLMNNNKTNSRESLRKSLAGALSAKESKKSGILTVAFECTDPKKAADFANAFIGELQNYNKGLAITEASQKKLFWEEHLENAKDALTRAEEAMKGFQEKTGIIKLDDELGAVISGISQLRAQIAVKEVQIKVMRTYAAPQNPDIRLIEVEIKALRERIGELESGASGNNIMVTKKSISSAGPEYIRKLRELKFSEALYDMMRKQYGGAKIDEARNPAVIQVIEKAIPPEQRVKPIRRKIVWMGTGMGFLFSVLAIFLMTFLKEYRGKALNNPENRERFETLKRYAAFRKK